jgi:hypothetical protein
MEPKWYDPIGVNRKPMFCPVCKTCLGSKEHGERFVGHCDECKAEFTWYPKESKPTVEMDKDKRHKTCGCGRCSG